ncbi:MAG: hypothetical protein EI684_17330 [Candidatus Viridilinea halotolerans]|uniref:Uncharacterized protein n=1 Tax=Candidatus Viridilinea halotolerans TaxID=2491704 RepID=A0A426TUD2_9CHLR|nr:MAG: hypothetical protein EI684_17330 [Candidatus Viridilinea halotolerans]
MGHNQIDEHYLGVLSDTLLYPEARQFLDRFLKEYELLPTKQMVGLLTFSRNWGELLRFVKHQEGRDWGNKDHYKQFYAQLRRYLDDAKTGLRIRIKEPLDFIPANLSRNDERARQEQWAGALAHEFVQHLVAAALYHAVGE